MPRRPQKFIRPGSRPLATTRRRFIQGSAAAVAGVALSNCRQNVADVQSGGEDGQATTDGNRTLHIYTWANYTDQALLDAFTEATGIEVVVDIFESNESMLAKMAAGGGDAYSVIYPSDYVIVDMINDGMLKEMDQSRIQGLENMMAQWQDPTYDPGNRYSVPFTWGTTGLLYNQEIISGSLEDWNYLWENQDALSRRITLLDDTRETMGAVLKSLGYSYNATDPAEIEAAYNRLMELKPHIAAFMTDGFEQQMLGGDLSVVMCYSVEGIAVTEEDERMVYTVPASGSSVWTDTIVIPAGAPDVDAAYEWINFVLQPQVSQGLVERLFTATPNQAAYDLLSEDLKTNPNLFPPEEVIARCEGIKPLEDDINQLYDQYWTQITSA